jgi:hypothetical protein
MRKTPEGPCPEWHDEKFEDILAWAGARVVYEDTFSSPKYGKRVVPELAHWMLLDGHGWLGFDCFKKREDEKKARMAGAMFTTSGWARRYRHTSPTRCAWPTSCGSRRPAVAVQPDKTPDPKRADHPVGRFGAKSKCSSGSISSNSLTQYFALVGDQVDPGVQGLLQDVAVRLGGRRQQFGVRLLQLVLPAVEVLDPEVVLAGYLVDAVREPLPPM